MRDMFLPTCDGATQAFVSATPGRGMRAQLGGQAPPTTPNLKQSRSQGAVVWQEVLTRYMATLDVPGGNTATAKEKHQVAWDVVSQEESPSCVYHASWLIDT